ncbi:Protein CBG14530 [Caenorhabditis briggsae]|uniref:Protein CBG14530 n=1 Tax=Caenorhabditis briggsae TaxID=6238 RepID=A8XK48_CAEBR|nr:Protein CBG14530 [Caenorhabditis briggsae]CAP33024.2 Protein CBG14530 [Caenorhabditis briggsae]
MWLWTSSLNFVLAILQLGFNLLVLIAVASDRRLHTNIHLLSTSLWVCNSITAIVTIFFSLNPSQCLEVPCFQHQQLPKQLVDMKSRSFAELEKFPALTTAILLNSTISLLTLLTIGFVHALARHNYHLSRSQLSRLIGSTWLLVTLLLLSDFFLIRLSRSFVLAVPFHLALLSVFLVLNLIIHPLNLIQLIISQRLNPEENSHTVRLKKDCATASLWLLLNRQNNSIMGIEVAAFSVHCVANPLIAVIRDRQLERSLSRIIMRNKRPRTNHEEDLIIALMRDPPPPYTE